MKGMCKDIGNKNGEVNAVLSMENVKRGPNSSVSMPSITVNYSLLLDALVHSNIVQQEMWVEEVGVIGLDPDYTGSLHSLPSCYSSGSPISQEHQFMGISRLEWEEVENFCSTMGKFSLDPIHGCQVMTEYCTELLLHLHF